MTNKIKIYKINLSLSYLPGLVNIVLHHPLFVVKELPFACDILHQQLR